MNKRTRAIDENTYKLIIATMKNGFSVINRLVGNSACVKCLKSAQLVKMW